MFCWWFVEGVNITIKVIMIILPFVGILLCVFGFFLTNPARMAWEKWLEELEKIENELKGKLIRKGKVDLVFPSEVRCKIENRCFCSGEGPWRIGCYAIPLTFIMLWVVSLVCSLHIFGYSSVCYVFVYN